MLLLRNGNVIDGTGGPPRRADLLISGERIAEIGLFDPPPAARVIDCAGLAVAPGFIDSHSHSDLQVLEGRTEKAVQGVTTEVVGNCGFSPYPAQSHPSLLRSFANGIFCGGSDWGWNVHDYLAAAARSPLANVRSLAGHGSLRIEAAGYRLGALTEAELDRMARLLEEALQAGAAGLSTGLMYAPGSSAPREEIERLCRIVARFGGIYTSHIRSYSADLVSAVDEQIEIARKTGVRLQISHLQAVGAANWAQQRIALDHIERAREEGVDVAFDCYPYVAGSTVLTQLMPDWVLEGGPDAMAARLADPGARQRAATDTEATIPWRWSDIYISAVASDRNAGAVGRNLAQLAEERGRRPVEVVLDLLLEERGRVNMLSFNQSEENLRQTLTHPLSSIVSDGFYVKGRPHPRLYGTFPFLLSAIARKRGWLTAEEAVHKITAKPAERFGIAGRGRVAKGYFADLVIFEPDEIDSPADYDHPDLPPVGIRCVLRNGKITHFGSVESGREGP